MTPGEHARAVQRSGNRRGPGYYRRSCLALAAAAGIALSGCGSENQQTDAPTATLGTGGAQVDVGDMINYGSFGTTAEIDCAEGKSLTVGGSNNTLTVRGTCSSLHVGGADNTINVDAVNDKISVVGINNTITYKSGDPKVENLGNANQINRP